LESVYNRRMSNGTTELTIEHIIPDSENLAHALWRVEGKRMPPMEFNYLKEAVEWVNQNYFDRDES